MHLQKMDFCHLTIWQQETLLYVCRFKYVPLFRFRSGSDDLQPSTDFPAWIMTFSIWLISSGGQSTTK